MTAIAGRRSNPPRTGSRLNPAVWATALGLHALLLVLAAQTDVDQPRPAPRSDLPFEIRLRIDECVKDVRVNAGEIASSIAASVPVQVDTTLLIAPPSTLTLVADPAALVSAAEIQSAQPEELSSSAPTAPRECVVMAEMVGTDSVLPRDPPASVNATPADATGPAATRETSPALAEQLSGTGRVTGTRDNGTPSSAANAAATDASSSPGTSSPIVADKGRAGGRYSPAALRTIAKAPRFLARAAARFSWHGAIDVLVELDAAGKPHTATVRLASGQPELDEAARRAALGFTYAPALQDGIPVPARVLVPFRF